MKSKTIFAWMIMLLCLTATITVAQSGTLPEGTKPLTGPNDLTQKEKSPAMTPEQHREAAIESGLTGRSLNEIFAQWKQLREQLKTQRELFTVIKKDIHDEFTYLDDMYKDGKRRIIESQQGLQQDDVGSEIRVSHNALSERGQKNKKQLLQDKAVAQMRKKESQDKMFISEKLNRIIEQNAYAKIYLNSAIEESIFHAALVKNEVYVHAVAFSDPERINIGDSIDRIIEQLHSLRNKVDEQDTRVDIKAIAKEISAVNKDYQKTMLDALKIISEKKTISSKVKIEAMQEVVSCGISTVKSRGRQLQLQDELNTITLTRDPEQLAMSQRKLTQLIHEIPADGGTIEDCKESMVESRIVRTDNNIVQVYLPGIYVTEMQLDNQTTDFIAQISAATGIDRQILEPMVQNKRGGI